MPYGRVQDYLMIQKKRKGKKWFDMKLTPVPYALAIIIGACVCERDELLGTY
jgi:hypothetical protein